MSRTIFRNVNLFDGVDEPRVGMSVAVEGNRIAGVAQGDAGSAEGDTVYDLGGRTLMPGMCIGHYHAEYDGLGRMENVNLGAERPPGVVMAYAVKNARIALNAGFTSALGTAAVYDTDINMVMAMEEKVCEGPRLVPCSPHIVATGTDFPTAPWWLGVRNLGLDQGQCTGPDEFRRFIRQEASKGVRMMKLLPSGGHGFPSTKGMRNISLDELQAAVAAAHERGCWIRAHVNYVDQILECIEAGMDIIDHADDLDDACIEAMVKHDVVYAPTIGMNVRTIRWKEGEPWLDFMKYYPRDESYIDRMSERLRQALKAGVKMMIGDDYGPLYGFSPDLWGRELNMFVDEMKFDPIDALRLVTANGARFFNNETGMVATGKLADIVVLDFDPIKDGLHRLMDPETHFLAIMKDGEFVKNRLPLQQAQARAA